MVDKKICPRSNMELIGETMNTLDYLVDKYKIDLSAPSPIEIPNVGRDSLPRILKDLKFTIGAEIGVEKGLNLKQLVKRNPKLKMFAVDPYVKYDRYNTWTEERFIGNHQIAHERLDVFPNVEFIEKFSMDALADFEDESLDFVYIDANHGYEFVLEDITGWEKKVRPGGILSGHDYVKSRHSKSGGLMINVKRAVQEFTRDNNISPWFILGTEGKVPGQIRDNSRSWMWVK